MCEEENELFLGLDRLFQEKFKSINLSIFEYVAVDDQLTTNGIQSDDEIINNIIDKKNIEEEENEDEEDDQLMT